MGRAHASRLRLDVLACPCGGRREVIALIEQRDVIVRILTHLGLPTELVSLRPARPPPSRQGAWAMAGQQTLDSEQHHDELSRWWAGRELRRQKPPDGTPLLGLWRRL